MVIAAFNKTSGSSLLSRNIVYLLMYHFSEIMNFIWKRKGDVNSPHLCWQSLYLFHNSNLHNKVGELTLQINTLYTLVTSDHNKMNQVVTHEQTINRQEVNTLINMQQQLTAKLEELKWVFFCLATSYKLLSYLDDLWLQCKILVFRYLLAI